MIRYFFLVQSFDYQCTKGHCGKPDPDYVIHGTPEDLARACDNHPKCKGFQFSGEKRYGHICSSIKNKGILSDYQMCVKSAGHNCIDIELNLKENITLKGHNFSHNI